MTTAPQNPNDMKAMMAASVAEALADMGIDPTQAQNLVQQAAQQAPGQQAELPEEFDFKDILAEIDPSDSSAGIAMLDWLLKTDRLNRIGVLDGGQGYMFIYVEPKFSDNPGYRPGATQGDRIVDSAVEHMEESGATPLKAGLCPHCMSAVTDDGSGIPLLADDEAPDRDKCENNGGGPHGFVS